MDETPTEPPVEPSAEPSAEPPASTSDTETREPSTPGSTRRWLFVALAIGVVVAVVAAVVLLRDDDKEAAPEPGEVFLESASSRGHDPFTASVAARRPARVTTTTSATPATTAAVRGTAVQTVGGATPALYGGSQDNRTCDPARLVRFLEANPDKARAFARVLGIAPSEIRAYVETLTPLVLTRDTRVTNHGYANGRATPRQAVLQAGTAVLVNVDGVPRVKCGCGNPLAPPIPTPVAPTYVGPRWPGFTPATITVVNVDVQVDQFIVVNVANGDKFVRPAGTNGEQDGDVQIDELCALFPEDETCLAAHPGQPSLGRGDVQVTLRWSSTADLDLSVTDPSGATIAYGSRSAPSGGTLDVDANASCTSPGSAPVENVFWPAGTAPKGVYTITVHSYAECAGGEGPQAYTVAVLLDGRLVDPDGGPPGVVEGVIAPGETQTYTITYS